MSETDSFIDEVTEEVRRDRLYAAFRKYGWIGGVVILGIVGGAAWSEWTKSKTAAEAQAFGDAILAAAQAENPEEALASVPAQGAGRAALAALMAGAQAAQSGQAEEALKLYRRAAASPDLPASLRDLARLKAVIVAGDKMAASDRDAELAALAVPGAPFRLMAVEQQALAKLAAGDRDGAIAMARDILADSEVTPGLQQRASELIVALGGDPAQE